MRSGLGDVDGAFYRSMERFEAGLPGSLSDSLAGCQAVTLELGWRWSKLLETGRGTFHRRQQFSRSIIWKKLKKISGIVPAVNQIECHPALLSERN